MKTTMFSQIRLALLLLTLGLGVAACGARTTNQYGLNEAAGFLLIGQRLIGLQVEVDGARSKTISKSDIDGSIGVWGARKNRDEKMQRILIEADSGMHDVRVLSDGEVIFEKRLYLSNGQQREVRVPTL